MAMENDKFKLENQLCFPLYACARRVVSLYNPLFKPVGITYTQYLVFLALWENDGQTVGDLCRRLYLDSGTLTPMLKKLEEKGFLDRQRSRDDERVVTIHLTGEGRSLREKVADIPEQVGCCIKLAPEEAETLYKLLYKVLGEL